MSRSGRYPQELRERAVRTVLDHRQDYPSEWAAISSIAPTMGVHRETLRLWLRRAQLDAGAPARLTTDERDRLKHLERENRELRRRAQQILKSASAFFGTELKGRHET